jgi:hypothetical protein
VIVIPKKELAILSHAAGTTFTKQGGQFNQGNGRLLRRLYKVRGVLDMLFFK